MLLRRDRGTMTAKESAIRTSFPKKGLPSSTLIIKLDKARMKRQKKKKSSNTWDKQIYTKNLLLVQGMQIT